MRLSPQWLSMLDRYGNKEDEQVLGMMEYFKICGPMAELCYARVLTPEERIQLLSLIKKLHQRARDMPALKFLLARPKMHQLLHFSETTNVVPGHLANVEAAERLNEVGSQLKER